MLGGEQGGGQGQGGLEGVLHRDWAQRILLKNVLGETCIFIGGVIRGRVLGILVGNLSNF